MKKVLSFLIIFIVSIFALAGCKEEIVEDTTITYKVNFFANEGGFISGKDSQVVDEGTSSEVVKAIPNDGYEFVSWSDGVKDAKRIIEGVDKDINLVANFRKIIYEYPSIYIYTESFKEITSKEVYLNCIVTVDDNKNPEYNLSRVEARIKGRGNSTWGKPKKPYRLKFNEKIDLFGNGKNKDWTLIANYVDPSLIRNYLTYEIGSNFDDLQFTTTTQFANVYVNGNYQGLYLICEQIETGKNRVEIDDSLEGNVSYLIELDERILEEDKKENLDYFFVNGQAYSIKAPKTDEDGFSESDCKKIKDHVQLCLDTIKNGTYEEVCAFVDVNTFADGYIIHELTSSIDVNMTSWYLYKDKDGKLCNGPIWDFDISMGNCDYYDQARFPDQLHATRNTWYRYLLRHQEFTNLVKEKIVKYYPLIHEIVDSRIDEIYNYSSYFTDNFLKWKILGKYEWPNPPEIVNIKTWEGQVEFVRDWLYKKLDYMMKQYNK